MGRRSSKKPSAGWTSFIMGLTFGSLSLGFALWAQSFTADLPTDILTKGGLLKNTKPSHAYLGVAILWFAISLCGLINVAYKRLTRRLANKSLRSRRAKTSARLIWIVRPLIEMSQSAVIASSPTRPWVWLFPLAYGLHIVEEYAFDFPAYIANVSGRHISNSQFLFLNAVVWLPMVAAVVVVRARPFHAWLIVTFAAVLGINAAVHPFSAASSPLPTRRALSRPRSCTSL